MRSKVDYYREVVKNSTNMSALAGAACDLSMLLSKIGVYQSNPTGHCQTDYTDEVAKAEVAIGIIKEFYGINERIAEDKVNEICGVGVR